MNGQKLAKKVFKKIMSKLSSEIKQLQKRQKSADENIKESKIRTIIGEINKIET